MKFRKITSEILRYWARVDLRILALTSTIVAQLVLLIWIIGNGEWILHRGVQVRLQIEALDPYDPVRGNRFEFVPSIFRHSFPCQAPIAPGQMVMVAPTEKGFSNWAVTTDLPVSGVPYYRVRVKSANAGHFFLEPPVREIYLNDAQIKTLKKRLNAMKKGQYSPIYLLLRHRGERFVVEGIEIDRVFYGNR